MNRSTSVDPARRFAAADPQFRAGTAPHAVNRRRPMEMEGRLIRDGRFLAALAAGPVVWLVMGLWQSPEVRPDWPLAQPRAFLMLVLLWPLVEELAFRGFLQGWLLERYPGRLLGPVSRANALTSLIFAGLHLVNRPWLWAVGVVAPSLLFGYFRERHASVIPAIVLHVWYNIGAFWLFGPLE